LEVGVEGGEAFVPAGLGAFPGCFVVSDREVDELTGGLVVGEVAADPDRFADDAVEAFDLVGIPYERCGCFSWPMTGLAPGGVRVGEYGATVRGGGVWEQTQVG
jgi:hypothetical protein